MSAKLRNIDEQVIVITGASSCIGLTTARMAAEQGAKLVLAARNGDALDQLGRIHEPPTKCGLDARVRVPAVALSGRGGGAARGTPRRLGRC